MIAFKGFTKDLTAKLGAGTYQYEAGKTYKEERSKCIATGFHCAENPFDCLAYYPLANGNRYFMVEAGGDIDEDGSDSKIACTELTLISEINLFDIAYYGTQYMIKHPKREWIQSGTRLEVAKNTASTVCRDSIVIARGEHPQAYAGDGSMIVLIVEKDEGIVKAKASMVRRGGKALKPLTWYKLDKNGEFAEAGNEI